MRTCIAALPPDAKTEAIALIKPAETRGNKLREPHSKALGNGLFEPQAFIRDLADRLAPRVQLTTDWHRVYLEAVEGAFGNGIDYAMLVEMYEADSGRNAPTEPRDQAILSRFQYPRGVVGR